MTLERKNSINRSTDFPILAHNHGKARVRVLKVKRDVAKHEVYEYEVATKLFNDAYAKVFTDSDNKDLVATDTQRNTVYVVAKRTKADSPEQFGIDICTHFLTEYSMLSRVEADIKMTKWSRAIIDNEPHNHGFEKLSPETDSAFVQMKRADTQNSTLDLGVSKIMSYIKDMTILKTTKSGFEKYLIDKYTLLPQTSERCMATELDCTWEYDDDLKHVSTLNEGGFDPSAKTVDYASIREKVRAKICAGFFGPAEKGVYSASLQATIYDIGCLVLETCPQINTCKIDTPNLHYLPMKALDLLGEKFEDDVFVPTCEPSGTITCTVGRNLK